MKCRIKLPDLENKCRENKGKIKVIAGETTTGAIVNQERRQCKISGGLKQCAIKATTTTTE